MEHFLNGISNKSNSSKLCKSKLFWREGIRRTLETLEHYYEASGYLTAPESLPQTQNMHQNQHGHTQKFVLGGIKVFGGG